MWRYLAVVGLSFTMLSLTGCASMEAKQVANAKVELTNAAEMAILTNTFSVYTDGTTISAKKQDSYVQKSIPVNSNFVKVPGCYVTCYSHTTAVGIFDATESANMLGLFRLKGLYKGNVCVPYGTDNADISKDPSFTEICGELFPSCQNKCWAKGNTLRWLKIATLKNKKPAKSKSFL